MHTFIRYQGSKQHFIKRFNKLTKNLKRDRYIEPFIGSGAILFNLDKEYNEYIINDLNEHIISIFESFRDLTYNDFIDTKKFIEDKFGDIKNSKESYYKFREFYNENYHFTDKIEKGIYLYFLANSCINSMLRFGPNGMNQSFGNRLYIMNKDTFQHINRILNKTIILNKSYEEIDMNNSLLFLDPPYFERPTSYTNNFSNNDLKGFLDNIKDLDSDILYTDIYDENTEKYLNWNIEDTKIITNTSPTKHKDKHREVVYYNFRYENTPDLLYLF